MWTPFETELLFNHLNCDWRRKYIYVYDNSGVISIGRCWHNWHNFAVALSLLFVCCSIIVDVIGSTYLVLFSQFSLLFQIYVMKLQSASSSEI